jgi:DNA-binding MarR family transcriptional regulator
MENLSSADEVYNLWLLFIKARRAVFKAREKELSQYGITPEQAGILFVVKHIGSRATPAEISRLTIREPHTVSGLVDRLEKAGLVKKVHDLDKKNLVRVAITEKGEQAYHHSTKRESIHHAMSSLSEEERQQLRSSLQKLFDKARQGSGR